MAVWTWMLIALGGVVAYEVLRHLIVSGVKRRYEKQIDRFLDANEIPTDSFRHIHRVVAIEQTLNDVSLAAAIAERAREDGRPVGDIQRKVRSWLEEIVPQFNLLAYYKIGYAVGRMAAYSVYNVRLDEESLKRAHAKVPDGASVVYVSNHRSNADFVVTGFMLSKSVQVSYAVGEWARVWPLESLFKSFGSYFVRRGETDPLYHRTLEAYVQLITKQAVTQAMFPEGGLSRDGALRPVKLGLLDSMAKAKLDPSFTKPLVFVPVGINFDRVLEDENMVAEADGAQRPQRSLATKAWRLVTLFGKSLYGIPINVVRFLAKRMKKHGAVAIHFGEPVTLDDWLAERPGLLEEPDRHTRWEALRPFAEDLLERIGRVVPVTPATWVCLALSTIGEERMVAGVDRGRILIAMAETERRLRAAGAPFETGDPYRSRRERAEIAALHGELEGSDARERALGRAMDVMASRGLLQETDDRWHTDAACWPLVMYYANSLVQYLPTAGGSEEE